MDLWLLWLLWLLWRWRAALPDAGLPDAAVAGSAWCKTCLDTPRLAPPPAFNVPAAAGDVPAGELDRYQRDCSAPPRAA